MRRAWRVFASALVAVGALASCANPPIPTNVARASASAAADWTAYSAGGVSFEHPTAWISYPVVPNPGPWSAVAVLSSTTFGPTCAPTTDLAGNPVTACHLPEPDLSGGGTFVDWTWKSSPIPSTSSSPVGTPTTVAGHAAVVDTSSLPPECTPTHAGSGEVVAIEASSGSTLVMTACFGAGDTAEQTADVDRMLASLQLDQ